MKGIVLAGGSGSRLQPMTTVVSKQLLPVYDKPLIYYPISTLMLAGIKDILIISTPEDQERYASLLAHFGAFGVNLTYVVQEKPEGIAQAFLLGEEFIGDDDCTLILGDNLFFGHDLAVLLREAIASNDGATVFGYRVSDPERYGVVEFNEAGRAIDIAEKPEFPSSSYAITGIYIYNNDVCNYAKLLKPSPRGELEITDINRIFLENDRLDVRVLGRGYTWLDTGTPDSLLEASQFVQMMEKRQGLKVACPEEIAWRNGWLQSKDLERIAGNSKSDYAVYLKAIINEVTF
jgi:glucose-1-phosphate thymidylyltransferase|tara:strand:- start:879 stop:1751 length:873 start_codon:yes stop_codon:yes gene_type:complete